MQVKITKPKIPILWLDTFAILNIVKAEKGLLNKTDSERYLAIKKLVYEKVREGKLICPEAHQSDEYELGSKLVKETNRAMVDLSLGIRLKPKSSVELFSMWLAMKAVVRKEKGIELKYNDIFFHDPIEELNQKRPFIIDVRFPTSKKEKEEFLKFRDGLSQEWEQLRQQKVKSGVSYKKQLTLEFNGRWDAYNKMAWNAALKHVDGTISAEDYMRMHDVGVLLSYWDRLGGKPKGMEGIKTVLTSEYYRSLPIIEIQAKMIAHIITRDSPVKVGDYMDIKQLSLVLPFSRFLLTDGAMKDLLLKLKLDNKYGVQVFSMKDFGQVTKALKSI